MRCRLQTICHSNRLNKVHFHAYVKHVLVIKYNLLSLYLFHFHSFSFPSRQSESSWFYYIYIFFMHFFLCSLRCAVIRSESWCWWCCMTSLFQNKPKMIDQYRARDTQASCHRSFNIQTDNHQKRGQINNTTINNRWRVRKKNTPSTRFLLALRATKKKCTRKERRKKKVISKTRQRFNWLNID